ncbi:hypothetical protein ACFX1X_002391 [Malus domestica]
MLITLGALTIESITGSHGKTLEKWSSSKGHPTWVSCSPYDSPPMIAVQGFVVVVCSKPCHFSLLNPSFNDNLTFQRSCQEGICDSHAMNIQQLQRLGIPNEDSAIRDKHLDDHAVATHYRSIGPWLKRKSLTTELDGKKTIRGTLQELEKSEVKKSLVRLLDHCVELEQPILVYEYIENGTRLGHLQT